MTPNQKALLDMIAFSEVRLFYRTCRFTGSADKRLYWPQETSASTDYATRIIDVTANANNPYEVEARAAEHGK